MAITVNIQDQCAAGHGKVTFTSGSTTWTLIFNKSEILEPITDEEMDLSVKTLIRFLKAASGSNTWAQMKTNFNNRVISL